MAAATVKGLRIIGEPLCSGSYVTQVTPREFAYKGIAVLSAILECLCVHARGTSLQLTAQRRGNLEALYAATCPTSDSIYCREAWSFTCAALKAREEPLFLFDLRCFIWNGGPKGAANVSSACRP